MLYSERFRYIWARFERPLPSFPEILFHSWGVEGAGAKSTYTASIEYTFPLEFAELVWSDGAKVDR